MLRETDKHFLMAMFSATGIILFWKGIWEGIGSLPLLESPWVSLFIGTLMLTVSGILFSEFDPLGGLEKSTLKIINYVHHHPQKHEYKIRYYDTLQKTEKEIEAKHIKHIEKNVVILHEGGKESFIPIHRVKSVHRKGSLIWKL